MTFNPNNIKGGDIILYPGSGWVPANSSYVPIDGKIILQTADGKEAIRIEPDGKFVVKGRYVKTNIEVYEKFKEWVDAVHAQKTNEP